MELERYTDSLMAVPPPALIYHYTDVAGLIGILRSGTLWCSDLFRLNDSSELRHGVDFAARLLSGAASTKGSGWMRKLFANTVAKALTTNIEQSANFFVCSFSENGDDLYQWRAYADNARGFALAFDADMLEKAFIASANDNHSSFPLSYENDLLETMQSKIVEQGLAIQQDTSVLDHQFLKNLSTRLSVNVIHCASFFKHPAYQAEKEYRFLQVFRGDIPVPELKTRQSTRYREYEWKSTAASALRSVWLGPGAADDAQDTVRRLLTEHLPNGDDVVVKRSTIPYRNV